MNPLFVLLLLTKVGAEREEQKGIKAHDAPKEPPVCKVHIVNTTESGDEDKNTKMIESVIGRTVGDWLRLHGRWDGRRSVLLEEGLEIIPLAECIEKEVCVIEKEGKCIKMRKKRDTQSCEFFAEIDKQLKARDDSVNGGNWNEKLVTPFIYFDLADSYYYDTSSVGVPYKPEDVKEIVEKHCSQLE